ncbi:hypothetical protein C8Q72DRAFT_888610 [Fomitopsis betulina]|nr:hypothetical protein C8Q72DRAFT_888610 [Fomitopsis betulina]
MGYHGALLWLDIFLGLVNYMYFSATALYVYDYLLTLDREIKYFWKAKQSFGTILFYFYRYPALVNVLFEVLSRMRAPWQTAGRSVVLGSWTRSQMALDGIILVSTAIFASVRVYALFHRKWWAFTVVLVTALINPVILFYLFTRSVPSIGTVEGFSSCTLALAGSTDSYETYVLASLRYRYALTPTASTGMIAARVAALLADSCVLVLTGIQTRQIGKSTGSDSEEDSMLGLKQSLKGTLLQGTVKTFTLLCLINVIGIATGRLDEFLEIWTLWTAILTSILISRLSLDLREVNSAYIDGGEVFTRTVLRDIPDFIHSESADSNHSEQLSSHHARAEVDSIDEESDSEEVMPVPTSSV